MTEKTKVKIRMLTFWNGFNTGYVREVSSQEALSLVDRKIAEYVREEPAKDVKAQPPPEAATIANPTETARESSAKKRRV